MEGKIYKKKGRKVGEKNPFVDDHVVFVRGSENLHWESLSLKVFLCFAMNAFEGMTKGNSEVGTYISP